MVHLQFRMQAVHEDMMKHVMNAILSNVLTAYFYISVIVYI